MSDEVEELLGRPAVGRNRDGRKFFGEDYVVEWAQPVLTVYMDLSLR